MPTSTRTPGSHLHRGEPPRRPHAVPAPASLRRHRGDVAAWALAHGHPLRRDALAAIVGVRAAGVPTVFDRAWTALDVARLLVFEVEEWCTHHGVPAPVEVAPTLSTYLRYLAAHRLLPPGSAHMSDLRRAIAEHRNDDRRRSRARHPASMAPVLPLA